MAGSVGQGPFLSPACHASEDEPWVSLEAYVGPKSEALHHAGAKALDECVGLFNEPQDRLRAIGVFEVHGHRTAPSIEDIELRTLAHGALAVDAYDFCAQV